MLRLCMIFTMVIFNINQVHASAWLLEQGQYKYTMSFNKVNKISRSEKKQREEAVLYINDRLAYLYQYREEVKDDPKLQQKILKQIKRLEQKIVELKSYQDELFNNIGIEYGITSNQTIGVYFLYKEDKFLGKKNYSNEASIYYKFKLFEDNDFVISAQPKILMNKNTGLKEDFFSEISLLSGTSKKIRFFSIFNQNVFSLGHSINNTKHKKMFYSVSTCEGIKWGR
ncbi:MAG: hypothetical protein ACIPMY_03455 [Rickettsia endosymbiont of Pentastiridius leporinus]